MLKRKKEITFKKMKKLNDKTSYKQEVSQIL